MAASRLRTGHDAAPRRAGDSELRWGSAGRAWPLYLGRNAARMLREYDFDYRSAGTIRCGPRRKEGRWAVWRVAARSPAQAPRSRARYFSFPAWPSFQRQAFD